MTSTTAGKIIPEREIFINIQGEIFHSNEIQEMSDAELQKLHSWLIAEEIMLTSAKEEWTGDMPGYDMKKGISFGVKINATRQFLSLVSSEINFRRSSECKVKEDSDQRIAEFLKILEVKVGKDVVNTIWNVVDNRLRTRNGR